MGEVIDFRRRSRDLRRSLDSMNKAHPQIFSKDQPTRAVARLGVDVPNVLISIMMTAVV